MPKEEIENQLDCNTLDLDVDPQDLYMNKQYMNSSVEEKCRYFNFYMGSYTLLLQTKQVIFLGCPPNISLYCTPYTKPIYATSVP